MKKLSELSLSDLIALREVLAQYSDRWKKVDAEITQRIWQQIDFTN